MNTRWSKVSKGTYVTSDPAEVRAFIEALDKEISGCGLCQQNYPVRHGVNYVDADGRATTHRCPSYSRFYNPLTRQFEGRSHCTCDYCW